MTSITPLRGPWALVLALWKVEPIAAFEAFRSMLQRAIRPTDLAEKSARKAVIILASEYVKNQPQPSADDTVKR